VTSQGSHVGETRGTLHAAGLRVGVLVARFNADITERLLDGALRCLSEHGASETDVDVYRVPGAWELPRAAARIAALGRHDALVALGCVIRGETPHFGFVCDQANLGLGEVARSSRAPLVFGVLTTENHPQALARAGDGPSNKGYEVTLAALQMIDLYRSLGDA